MINAQADNPTGDRSGGPQPQDGLDERRRGAIYRALFDGIGDTVLLAQDGRCIDCNDRALAMFRCTREQLTGKSLADLSPEFQPDGRASVDAARENVGTALGGVRLVFEWQHRRFDGHLFDAEVTLTKVEIPGEMLFFAIVRDTSERKAVEARLTGAHKRFACAFDTGPDAMLVTTMGSAAGEGVIMDVNRVAETMFGVERETVLGKKLKDLGEFVSLESVGTAREGLVKRGLVHGLAMRLTPNNAAALEAQISSSRFDLDGESYALIVIRDMTGQNEAERQIRELSASLKTERDMLVTAFQANPDAVVIATAGGPSGSARILDCNDALEHMVGFSRAELIGRTLGEIGGSVYVELSEAIRETLDRRAVFHNFPVTLPRKNGSRFAAEISAARFCVGDEQRAIYVIRDVAQQREAERKIRELTESLLTERDKLSTAFQAMPDAVLVSTLGKEIGTGFIMDCNEAAEQMFGAGRDQLIGKSILEAGIVANVEDHLAVRQQLAEKGVVRNFPAVFVRRDGTRFEAEDSIAIYRYGGERRFVSIIRDVSERNAAARRIAELNTSLRASLKQIRDITDNLPVFVSYHDMQRRFVFANRTAQQWMAKSEPELLGKTAVDVMPSNLDGVKEELVARDPAVAERVERVYRFPDGKVRTIDAVFVPDIGADDAQHGYYTLIVDITEQRTTEEKLRQSQKMDAIGKLTGGIAHDFGNLLAVVQGCLELAAERLDRRDPETMRLLKPALVAAKRGGTLTRSLLAFARQQTLSPSVVDVNELARDTVELLRRTLPANIEIVCLECTDSAKSEVDTGQLQNALLTLAVNGRDAMPDGGRLTIETGTAHLDAEFARTHPDVSPGDYVTIAVTDTGMGMPPAVVARAFEPFFTTKSIGRGTGLGLSMVYGFAKQSKGHVSIASEVGRGTTVRLYLPRCDGRDRAGHVRDAVVVRAGRQEHVLVVEDDEDVRFIAATMLQNLGYVVREAANADQALKEIQGKGPIDLLITDLVLSEKMNGLQLARAARAARPGIAILCMSGYAEDALPSDRRLEPGMHFIQKPFGKNDLAQKVRAVLDGEGAAG